jgi:hypothetical protein
MVSRAEEKSDIILLHNPTLAEHPDADLFRKEVSDYIRVPITDSGCGRGLFQLINEQHCLPSTFIPFCTRIMKHEPMDKFLQKLNDDFILYVGYDIKESHRVNKQLARFESKGYKSRYPLHEKGLTNCDAKEIVSNHCFTIPSTYNHLNHNNCLPCFKGGLGHFWSVWKFYPDYFQKAVDAEKMTGHTVFKTKSLIDLSIEWESGKRPRTATENGIPCVC